MLSGSLAFLSIHHPHHLTQVVSVRAVKEYCNVGVGSTDVTLRVLEEQEAGAWWEEEGEGGGGAGSVI